MEKINGYIIRDKFDNIVSTDLMFIYNDNIVYLPTDTLSLTESPKGKKIPTSIIVNLLDEETPFHQHPKCRLDTKPSLFGWVSRAKNKAFCENSKLCFSTHKPTNENGFFVNKEHSFGIDETEFVNVKELDEPIPATIILTYNL